MNIRQLASLNGRATRTQFVTVYLVLFVVLFVVASIRVPRTGDLAIATFFGCLTVGIPCILAWLSVATTVRRLHDFNYNGWWSIVINFTGVGNIFLIALALRRPVDENRFGPDPRDERERRNLNAT